MEPMWTKQQIQLNKGNTLQIGKRKYCIIYLKDFGIMLFQMVSFAPTNLRIDYHYIQIYILWMKLIVIEIIPYVIIIVLNIWMAVE